MAEVDHAVDRHDGEAAALILTRWLGIGLLICLGVHELDRASVNSLEGQAMPEILGPDTLGQCGGDAP